MPSVPLGLSKLPGPIAVQPPIPSTTAGPSFPSPPRGKGKKGLRSGVSKAGDGLLFLCDDLEIVTAAFDVVEHVAYDLVDVPRVVANAGDA